MEGGLWKEVDGGLNKIEIEYWCSILLLWRRGFTLCFIFSIKKSSTHSWKFAFGMLRSQFSICQRNQTDIEVSPALTSQIDEYKIYPIHVRFMEVFGGGSKKKLAWVYQVVLWRMNWSNWPINILTHACIYAETNVFLTLNFYFTNLI